MGRKKRYKGIVVQEFVTRGKTYKIGDTFSSISKESIEYLIKTKRIK